MVIIKVSSDSYCHHLAAVYLFSLLASRPRKRDHTVLLSPFNISASSSERSPDSMAFLLLAASSAYAIAINSSLSPKVRILSSRILFWRLR